MNVNSTEKSDLAGPVEPTVKLYWEATPLALFAGPTYYPSPGFRDLRGLFASLEDAVQKGKDIAVEEYGWWQVVDLFTLNIVAGEGKGHSGLGGYMSAA